MALDLECPWKIESLEDFLYYCCPECNERTQSRNIFLHHALEHHPISKNYLLRFEIKEEVEDFVTDIEFGFDHTVNKFMTYVENNSNLIDNKQQDLLINNVESVNRNENHNVEIKDVDEEEEFVVEKIIDKRKGPHGKLQYLIKWKGYEDKDNSWEPIDNIYCDDLIAEFENEQSKNKVILKVKEENFTDNDTIQGQQFSDKNLLKKEDENGDYYDNNIDMEDQDNTEFSDKQCKKCGKTFKTYITLKKHLARGTHTKTRRHKCDKCEKKFKTVYGLRYHIKNFHGIDDKAKTECNSCGKIFRFQKRFENLIIVKCVHEGQHRFHCANCDKSFSDTGNLRKHIIVDHEGTKFICHQDECGRDGGKNFISEQALNIHIDKVHKGVRNQVCQICGMAFFYKGYLNHHLAKIHDGRKKYRCDFGDCLESYDDIKFLRLHHKAEHKNEEWKYKCDKCKYGTNKEMKFLRHIKGTHEEHREICHHCGKKFKFLKLLESHIVTKHTEKPEDFNVIQTIQIDPCSDFKDVTKDPRNGKHGLFTSKTWEYFLLNKEAREVKCRICGEKFQESRKGLDPKLGPNPGEMRFGSIKLKHLREKHKLEIETQQRSSAPDRWKCKFCGKCFNESKPLRTHLNTHTGARPHKCEHCGKSFADDSNRINHIKSVHLGIKRGSKTSKISREEVRNLSRLKLLNPNDHQQF